MSLTWNSWARLPSRWTSCADEVVGLRDARRARRGAEAARGPVQVDLELDVARVGVGEQDVVGHGAGVGGLELAVVVVDHQRLAGLAGPLAERVEVLRVGDPLGFGGVVARRRA